MGTTVNYLVHVFSHYINFTKDMDKAALTNGYFLWSLILPMLASKGLREIPRNYSQMQELEGIKTSDFSEQLLVNSMVNC